MKHIVKFFIKTVAVLGVLLFAAAALETNADADSAIDAIKARGKVRIAVFGDKPPFGYLDEKGDNAGFDIIIAKRVVKDLLGDENAVEWVLLEPANRVDYLEADKVDIVFANFTVTKARAERVDFALPYMKVAIGVVSPSKGAIKSIEDLKGKKLIIIKGTTAETYFSEHHPDVELLKFDEISEAFQALTDGRGSGLSQDNTFLFAWAAQNQGYTVGIPTLGSLDTIAPAVRKGNTELLNWLNDELKKLGGENFIHKAYKEALEPIYGDSVNPDDLVVEGGEVIGKAVSTGGDAVEFRYPEWVYYDLIYLADDLGYFKNANVKPRYVGQIAAGQMIPALTTGDLDVANRHTPLVVAAVASGADIKIFAAGSKSTQRDPHMKYFVRVDSPIQSIKDFSGKTLGINSFGACSEFVTKKYAQDNGVDPSSIKMITAPDAEQEVPLLRGDTDVAIIHPLASGRASANTKDFRMLFSDWDIDGGISGMCPYSVNGEFLKAHPEAVRELTAILSKAAQWNNSHREEARQLMAKRFGFKLEEAEMFEFYEDQVIPEENIEYWLDRLQAEKKIVAGQIKPEQVFTNLYNPAK